MEQTIIPCPTCGKARDFSRLPATVTDWQALIPLIVSEPCEGCRITDILLSLKVVCLNTGDEPTIRTPRLPLKRKSR